MDNKTVPIVIMDKENKVIYQLNMDESVTYKGKLIADSKEKITLLIESLKEAGVLNE